jgi:MYXO-CTERM domain-containing protein
MFHTTRAPLFNTRPRRAPASLSRRFVVANAARTSAAAVLLWSAAAGAQVCPSSYSTCDNGGCCLSAEQCCSRAEQGCCSSATPFCCEDGTCAATPSQCGSVARADCDGYDVPCGGGCAPAGSDCCDVAGHFCPPESMCTSGTTCVRGATATIASQVEVTAESENASRGPVVAAPYADPGEATDRSCSMAQPASAAAAPAAWLMLALGLLGLGWRRGVRRRSIHSS